MYAKLFLSVLLFCGISCCARAQQIKGVVQDRETKAPMANVQLVNIYNSHSVFTDSMGSFTLEARQGELVELHCPGYNVARFRLSKGFIPSFFKLYIDKITVLNTDPYASSGLTQYQIDSIKSRKLYKTILDHPRMSVFQQVESPFTAAADQKKWDFQDNYALFEREKYIDFTFNETLVKQLTGLEGTELQQYMKRYRPTYEALRNMSLYDYYLYIRVTAERFRRIGKPTAPRNSG